jgi:hypothetical protein
VQRRHLRLAPEQPGQRWRGHLRSGRCRTGGAPGDGAFGLVQRGRRVEAGLVGQPAPVLPPGAQRFRGLSDRCERPHEREHGRLAQRVGGHRLGREPEHRARLPRRDGRSDQRVGDVAVQPRAALHRGCDRLDVGEVGEHGTPPQRVRLAQQGKPWRVRAGRREQRPGLREVQLAGRQVEAVAVLPGLQPGRGRPELCPQPEQMRVQRLPR